MQEPGKRRKRQPEVAGAKSVPMRECVGDATARTQEVRRQQRGNDLQRAMRGCQNNEERGAMRGAERELLAPLPPHGLFAPIHETEMRKIIECPRAQPDARQAATCRPANVCLS